MMYANTKRGFEDFAIGRALARYGAMAARLPSPGCGVAGLDRDTNGSRVHVPHAMVEHSGPTRISPVFVDLRQRQLLQRAGFRLCEHLDCSSNNDQLPRKPIAWAMRLAPSAFSCEALLGDNHIFVVEAWS
jgi:hypothetical protein